MSSPIEIKEAKKKRRLSGFGDEDHTDLHDLFDLKVQLTVNRHH